MITVKIDNVTKKTKAYETAILGAYEYATVKIDGWWMMVRKRIGNPIFVFYKALKNQDKIYSVK